MLISCSVNSRFLPLFIILLKNIFHTAWGVKILRHFKEIDKKTQEIVEKKEFRDDLYYRLSVAQVRIPPLRERPEDIPLLLKHFISRFYIGEG